jgi:diketogulonate reductase-like aldo/keto reductase
VLTIAKAGRADHVAENAGAAPLRLSAAEIARLERAFPRGRRPRELPTL